MPDYREIAPSPRLAASVECFWSGRFDGTHRVLPDGCADILLTQSRGTASLAAIGAMTGYRDIGAEPGQTFFGVRFRPGCWAGRLGMPADRITDLTLPLELVWGRRSGELLERLASAGSDERRAAIFESLFDSPPAPSPVQRAIRWMEQRHGAVSLDEAADQCALSVRQFRRLCLAETGLTPKFLARVMRFRHAVARLATVPAADLALDCGYYDQSHLINEFRELSGRPPAAYLADFSNRGPAVVA